MYRILGHLLYSLSYSTALVPNAGTNHVHLICMFIRYNSCLQGKVKYCVLTCWCDTFGPTVSILITPLLYKHTLPLFPKSYYTDLLTPVFSSVLERNKMNLSLFLLSSNSGPHLKSCASSSNGVHFLRKELAPRKTHSFL